MKRQPRFSLYKGDKTAKVCMNSVNPKATAQYFDLLNDVLEEYALKQDPRKIHNVDKTGMSLDHRPPKIEATRKCDTGRLRTRAMLPLSVASVQLDTLLPHL